MYDNEFIFLVGGNGMICNNCGKEIKEGATYCLECGAPLEEPKVITLSKEDIKNANRPVRKDAPKNKDIVENIPFFDYKEYISESKNDPTIFLSLIGALLLYVSAFTTWTWEKLFDNQTSATLFDLGIKGSDMFLSKKFLVIAICVFIVGIIMICMSASDYIRPLINITEPAIKIVLQVLPIVIAIALFFLIIKDKEYSTFVKNIDGQVKLAKNLGSTNYSGGKGLGPVFYIAGTLLYSVSAIINIVKGKDN